MEEQREDQRYSEYFVLASYAGDWMISRRMAEFVEDELDHWPRRRWICFVDLLGARVRLRTDLIKEAPDEPSDWEVDW